MKYIPSSEKQVKQILKELNVPSFDSLIKIIPESLLFKKKFNIDKGKSELEIQQILDDIASKNRSFELNFIGSGIYNHYIPTIVDFISSRSEFYTAYTPYQAEVSQGTLQYLYEYQTMICELTKMDVSNASLYDASSACVEACNMALNAKSGDIIISQGVNPFYIDVIKTNFNNRNVNIKIIKLEDGVTDYDKINFETASCVLIQSPNYYGQLENWTKIKSKAGESTTLIAVSDPISLSILSPPGECGADIYVGEGQGLGNYSSFGGPLIGVISSKKKFLRKMPGRIVGKTTDMDGNDAFTLVLQTREQHIRRDKATSNICTNQGLMALRSAIYISTMGYNGIKEVALQCFNKANYAAKKIDELRNFELLFKNNFLREFIVKSNLNIDSLQSRLSKKNIFLEKVLINRSDYLKISITETKTKEQIDLLVKELDLFEE